MKGFFFTTDSLIALAIASAMIMFSMAYIQQIDEKNQAAGMAMSKLADDFSVAVEKSGLLGDCLDSNGYYKIKSAMEKMPYEICMELEIYEDGRRIADISRECNAGGNRYVAERVFWQSDKYYRHVTKAWVRPLK